MQIDLISEATVATLPKLRSRQPRKCGRDTREASVATAIPPGIRNIMKKSLLMLLFAAVGGAVFSQPTGKELFGKKYIRSVMLKAANWQLQHPKHDPRDWTNGALYAGIYATWETTRSKPLYRAMTEMGEKAQWQPFKRWYHADDIAICQLYLDLYRREKKPEMIQATVDTVKKFIAHPYPTKGVEVIKWWWCDALFMAPPALVKLGLVTANAELLKKNDEYYRECYDLLYDREEHLFARDLNFVIKNDGKDRRESNGKKIFWSRGNGWVMAGLARILEELPDDYPRRPFYEQLFREMAAKIISIQQPDGLWRTSLLDPDAYPGGEASGSGFYCYALAWGINSGLLEKATFLPAVQKAWTGLNRCVNEEGRVGWVQPIDGNPRRNVNADSWEVYGTGAFLLAGSEVIKLKNSE
ncbi:MAG: glycoside hydrolase family 88 protein [Bacteroidales bacterium]|jgi:rhamnogalacturonyl hydrolase YesR|nr:glycoside hydrolase family 88 protein [Bacteroidales bacterium]